MSERIAIPLMARRICDGLAKHYRGAIQTGPDQVPVTGRATFSNPGPGSMRGLGRAEELTSPSIVVSRDVSREVSRARCPFPFNPRHHAALFAGVLQVSGTESGRVCRIQLTHATASLAVEPLKALVRASGASHRWDYGPNASDRWDVPHL